MLYFTVSIPRAGKTTFAQRWKNEGKNRVLVSGDQIRLAVYNQRFSVRGEPMVHAVKQYMLRTLLLEGYDVLFDDTNTTWKSVQMVFEIDYSARYIIIDCDPVECQRRAMESGQEDLVRVIEKMYPNYLSTVNRLRTQFPHLECKI